MTSVFFLQGQLLYMFQRACDLEMLGGVFAVSLLQLFALTSAAVCIEVSKQHEDKHIGTRYKAKWAECVSQPETSCRAAGVPSWAAR